MCDNFVITDKKGVCIMVKQLRKVGNSNALTLDRAIMELVGLSENGHVQITVHDGSIILTPVKPHAVDNDRFEACLEHVFRTRRKVLRRLAQ
jgi:antitoxin component of MazEF toxin-antitoxin module